MHASIISALALASTAVAMPAQRATRATPSTFVISPRPLDGGNVDLDNLYLQKFHTYAGKNALVGTKDKAAADRFYIQDGKLVQQDAASSTLEVLYETILHDEATFETGLPGQYRYLSFDASDNGNTTFGIVHNVPKPSYGSEFFVGLGTNDTTFGGFVLCTVDEVSPDTHEKNVVELLWQKAHTDDVAQCAKVSLDIYD